MRTNSEPDIKSTKSDRRSDYMVKESSLNKDSPSPKKTRRSSRNEATPDRNRLSVT